MRRSHVCLANPHNHSMLDKRAELKHIKKQSEIRKSHTPSMLKLKGQCYSHITLVGYSYLKYTHTVEHSK